MNKRKKVAMAKHRVASKKMKIKVRARRAASGAPGPATAKRA